jgi:predicted ATPase
LPGALALLALPRGGTVSARELIGMITRLHVKNYRSVGERAELDLGRLTALVGPNGAGKSNLADALRFIADCMRMPLSSALAERGGIRAVLHAGADPTSGLELRVDVENELGGGWWSVTIVPENGHGGFRVEREEAAWRPTPSDSHARDPFRFLRAPEGWEGPPGYVPMALPPTDLALLHHGAQGLLAPLVGELRSMAVYAIFPNTLRAPQAPNPSEPMSSGGENWASTLAALDRSAWGAELMAALGRLVGDIDDYEVTDVGGRYLIPRFRHRVTGERETPRWLAAAQESDGTLRLAGILTALFQQPSPSLLGFEEPELAIHPGAIPVLYDFIAEASVRSQILLTTHSPDLLDLLPLDDVRVVDRRGGATTVARVDPRQRDLVKKRLLSASEILHAEGLRPEDGSANG